MYIMSIINNSYVNILSFIKHFRNRKQYFLKNDKTNKSITWLMKNSILELFFQIGDELITIINKQRITFIVFAFQCSAIKIWLSLIATWSFCQLLIPICNIMCVSFYLISACCRDVEYWPFVYLSICARYFGDEKIGC